MTLIRTNLRAWPGSSTWSLADVGEAQSTVTTFRHLFDS